MLSQNQPPPSILLAEDDENDIFFMERAVAKAGISNPLVVVRDGEQAVKYLNGDGPFADRDRHPLPGLLLLDLKMPRMDGFEVLIWLSRRPDLHRLPVVVLSSSSIGSDIVRAKSLGAKEYHCKPAGSAELQALLEQLHGRWLGAKSGLALGANPSDNG